MTRLIELPTGSAAWGKAGKALSGLAKEAADQQAKEQDPLGIQN
jgi:hypothetical protein